MPECGMADCQAPDPSEMDNNAAEHLNYREELLRSIEASGIRIDKVQQRGPQFVALPIMKNQERNKAAVFRYQLHSGRRPSDGEMAPAECSRSHSVGDEAVLSETSHLNTRESKNDKLSMYLAVFKQVEDNTVIKQLRRKNKTKRQSVCTTSTELPQFHSTPATMSKATWDHPGGSGSGWGSDCTK